MVSFTSLIFSFSSPFCVFYFEPLNSYLTTKTRFAFLTYFRIVSKNQNRSGLYLDMLGEFYMRAFTSFVNLYVNLPKQQQLNFYTTTQLYVVTKKLLLSHETFLNVVSNRPNNNDGVSVLSYKQLLKYGPTTKSLQPPNPNNNQTKHNIPQCTCVKRLYFCSGVEAEAEAEVDGMENQQQERQQKNNNSSSSSSSMKRKRIHLSTGDIQQHIRSIGSPTKISIQKFRTQLILQRLRFHINSMV